MEKQSFLIKKKKKERVESGALAIKYEKALH